MKQNRKTSSKPEDTNSEWQSESEISVLEHVFRSCACIDFHWTIRTVHPETLLIFLACSSLPDYWCRYVFILSSLLFSFSLSIRYQPSRCATSDVVHWFRSIVSTMCAMTTFFTMSILPYIISCDYIATFQPVNIPFPAANVFFSHFPTLH